MKLSLIPLNRRLKGISLILVASLFFALMFSVPKLVDAGLNGLQSTFIRYLSGLLTITPILFFSASRGGSFKISDWPIIILRASAGVGGFSCIIYATNHMSYADAIAISFTDGAFIIVLASVFLREIVTVKRWVAAIVCIFGAFLIAQPTSDLLDQIWVEPAAKIAFFGAFVMACEIICIKYLTERVSAPTLLFYTNLIAVILSVGPAFVMFDWPPLSDILFCAFMGPLAIVGQFLFMQGLRSDDLSALVPYKYSIILFSGVLGIFLFDELPDLEFLLGAVLIISASIILSRRETLGNK
ncbi:MAG: hypothetical protein CBB68_00490 [Rhodospirillaceae bacterium TMED8]|nr:hypothetical protein [Magnetovibrio sp.]OUT53363.1 MAG: hypothetical protein CBB68_00490 [Rhodospirillaceae bacterium TMED8]